MQSTVQKPLFKIHDSTSDRNIISFCSEGISYKLKYTEKAAYPNGTPYLFFPLPHLRVLEAQKYFRRVVYIEMNIKGFSYAWGSFMP